MKQIVSLFSGIGGFELAGKWMGWDPVVSCEINPFGRKVLEYYFPEAYHHDDVKTLTYETIKAKSRWDENKSTVLVGGFPCQPYSLAGKRLGKEDERHLWPEMLRVIREIQPRWVVGENVFGLVNWNGGLVFNEVQTDLEAQGYEVQPFILPACGVNAPHRRDRVWFVAYAHDKGRSSGHGQVQKADGEVSEWNNGSEFGNASDEFVANPDGQSGESDVDRGWEKSGQERESVRSYNQSNGGSGVVADAENIGHEQSGSPRERRAGLEDGNFRNENASNSGLFRPPECQQQATRAFECGGWDGFPTQSPIRSRNDGFSPELVGITVSKHRQESLKAYGNAIVPQVVYQIFKAIEQYEH